MRFAQRVVLITGGGKGIGAGCARVFAQEGGSVAIVDRDEAAGNGLLGELGSGHLFIQADASDTKLLEAAVVRTIEKFGRLDCLINNVGIHPPDTPIELTTPDDALRTMQINFISTYAMSLYALPELKKTRGSIVNISSMTAVLGQKNSCAYAASKGAQLSFTKSLALETAPYGVRVNAILPSNVDTPLMRQWAATLPDPEAALQRIAALQPLGRMAAPEEIGRVCLFLATDDSSFMTGQGLEVDGGAALDY
jgi:L-fucose dehydrogenase